MPLVAWSVLAYSLSLIVALSSGVPGRFALGAAALVGTIACMLAGRRTIALVCAVAAGANLVASAAAVSDARCAGILATASQWRAEFGLGAEAGDVSHALLTLGDCAVGGTILVEQGSVRAGESADVRGIATRDVRGLFVAHAILSGASGGSAFAGLRASTGRRIDRIFGTDAPMARALVIGDMSQVPAEQRDRYAAAGLAHLLSMSGLHVGIVALTLSVLASLLRIPPVPARVMTLGLLGAYVAAIGAPPPAVRAAVMLGTWLASRLLQRPTSPWAILAIGAAAPLRDPHAALQFGWQLSVVGAAALIAGAALAKRVVPRKWRGWRRALAHGAIIGVVATVVTSPLVAWAFGRVALLGPVTSILANPVMAVLQPVLFVAVAVPVRAVEILTADAAHALLLAFNGIARAASSIPYAAPSVMPSVAGAVIAAAASIAVIVACLARDPVRPLLVGGACFGLLVIQPLLPHLHGVPELHMIDVGQGDALALRTSKGRWIVVDAGRTWEGGDAGRSTVAPYLSRRGGDVALFVLSHPHADHVGGAASLFALLHPARFLDPGYVGTTPSYRLALAEARKDRIPWQRVHPGDSLVVDDVVLTTLAPDSAWAAHLADANLASTVLVARMGSHRVLLTGDAEAPEEAWLLEHVPDALHADVLKVAHHGSATSSTQRFLSAVRPRIALVSVGAHNAYHLPDEEIMAALRVAGVATLRTDRLGTVVLRFLDGGVEVNAHGEQWLLPNQVIR